MNILKKKWNELMYSLNSEDHYAEYNPRDPVSFNMGRRVNNASRVRLTASTDELHDEEMGFGADDGGEEINIDEFSSSDNSGVSETLLAWRHIDLWSTEHNPDLNATLGDPCTHNDISNAEEDLAVAFPSAVKVSFRVHDGQEDLESLAGTSGLIYGLQLMSLDQVVEMTEKWRSVAKGIIKQAQASAAAVAAAQQQQEVLLQQQQQQQQKQGNSRHQQSIQTLQYQQKLREKNMRTSLYPTWEDPRRRQFKLPNIPEQRSVPANCIQPVYAHPGWIPLTTDHAGNHIAVDLAPAPGGKYAQIIIFGRDFDTKYVIADNWGDFLLMFANDLEAGNWYLVDDSDDFLSGEGELVFRDKKTNGPVLDYLEVLKRRAIYRANELAQSQSQPESQIPSNENSQSQQQENGHSFLDDDSLEDSNNTVTHKDLPEFGDLGEGSLQKSPEMLNTKVTEGGEEPVKAEPKKEELVKEETVKAEPKKEEPKKEEPVKAEPKKEEPKKEEPKKEEPKKEEPKKEEPKKEEPKKEEPKKEEPKKEEPKKEEPKKEEPKKEEPKKEEPKKEEPKKEKSKKGESKKEKSKKEEKAEKETQSQEENKNSQNGKEPTDSLEQQEPKVNESKPNKKTVEQQSSGQKSNEESKDELNGLKEEFENVDL